MLAVAANKYFDNPFRVFNGESDFNIDPYLIGSLCCWNVYVWSWKLAIKRNHR